MTTDFNNLRIARVFPRRTKATPTDELAFTGPPGLFPPEVDRVHVSVAFTGELMMTGPIVGYDGCPIHVDGRPDLLDDGMLVQSESGSRYLLDGRQGCPSMEQEAR